MNIFDVFLRTCDWNPGYLLKGPGISSCGLFDFKLSVTKIRFENTSVYEVIDVLV